MLWDVDYTLVGADGLGTRLYEVVFREMFGRELTEVAPKAGRTDLAIVGDTLALAGVPAAATGPFLAALATGARVVGVATGSYPAADLAAAGAQVVLPGLTDTGVVLAAVTGSPREGEAAPAR